jgi:hypothetical protein
VPTSTAPSPPADLAQLPFLIRLLDDPSPAVRKKVGAQVRALGILALPEIERLELPLTSSQRVELQAILAPAIARSRQSPESFLDWMKLDTGENEKLEAAYGWLSRWRWGPEIGAGVHEALDNLANEYREYSGEVDPEALNAFLFHHKKLRGAPSEDFYEAENSDLMTVIETGQGIPISLSCIFILVAHRIGVDIVGCNYPGNFMARAPIPWPPKRGISFMNGGMETDLVFDCYNGGRVLMGADITALRKSADFEMRTAANTCTIMLRVLYNVATAYHIAGDRDLTRFFLKIRKQLEEAYEQELLEKRRAMKFDNP